MIAERLSLWFRDICLWIGSFGPEAPTGCAICRNAEIIQRFCRYFSLELSVGCPLRELPSTALGGPQRLLGVSLRDRRTSSAYAARRSRPKINSSRWRCGAMGPEFGGRTPEEAVQNALFEWDGMITAREVLEAAAVEGARANGLLDRTGTLSVGKQADIVMLDARRIHVGPMNDPIGLVATAMDTSHVDSVMVAGEFRRRDGTLVGVDVERVLTEAEASRDAVLGRL